MLTLTHPSNLIINATLLKLEDGQFDDGTKIQSTHWKMGQNKAIKTSQRQDNIFYGVWNHEDEGKMFRLEVSQEANGNGGIRFRVVQWEILESSSKDETAESASF